MWRAIVTHRGVLARIGTGVGLLAAIRASRTVIVPLWAVSIGMRPDAAALVIGIAAAVDFALFYVSGHVVFAEFRFDDEVKLVAESRYLNNQVAIQLGAAVGDAVGTAALAGWESAGLAPVGEIKVQTADGVMTTVVDQGGVS